MSSMIGTLVFKQEDIVLSDCKKKKTSHFCSDVGLVFIYLGITFCYKALSFGIQWRAVLEEPMSL